MAGHIMEFDKYDHRTPTMFPKFLLGNLQIQRNFSFFKPTFTGLANLSKQFTFAAKNCNSQSSWLNVFIYFTFFTKKFYQKLTLFNNTFQHIRIFIAKSNPNLYQTSPSYSNVIPVTDHNYSLQTNHPATCYQLRN